MGDMLKLNAELAELCGAFLGDGWIESRKSVMYIAGDIREDKEYFDLHLGPLFSREICEITPQLFIYWNVYGIRCCKRKAISKCIDAGFQPGKKVYLAKIPDWIVTSEDKDLWIGVLRGIFDTDGCFYCDKSRSSPDAWRKTYHCRPEIHIVSCSEQLLLQMQCLLVKLEIDSILAIHGVEGYSNARNRSRTYYLRIRKIDQVKKWFDIIGSNNPRHKTKFELWKKFGFVPPRTTLSQRKDILSGEMDPYTYYQ
jgi:hypothetical protein